jgi:DHA1 family tetracycline resistance protein-like MFS transporter
MAVLNLLTILLLLPESLTAERKAELAKLPNKAVIDFAGILDKMAAPRVGPLLIIRLFSSVAGALFMTLFTLWTKDRLGLNAQSTSYLMAYQGLLSILVQIGLIGPLTKRFSDAELITLALPLQAVALLMWAFTSSVPVLVVVLIPLSLATGVLNTVINSAVSWAVLPHEMGDALGTAGALESLSRVIAPTVGGWLLGALGAWAPGVLAASILGGLTAFAWRRLIARPDTSLASAATAE